MRLWGKLLCWWYHEPLWYYHRVLIKKPDGRLIEEYGMFWCPNCERWVSYPEVSGNLSRRGCDSCGTKITNCVNAANLCN
jgi:hypothetical protein